MTFTQVHFPVAYLSCVGATQGKKHFTASLFVFSCNLMEVIILGLSRNSKGFDHFFPQEGLFCLGQVCMGLLLRLAWQNKSTEHSLFSISLAAATIAIWMWVCCQIDLNCYYTLIAPQRNQLHVNQWASTWLLCEEMETDSSPEAGLKWWGNMLHEESAWKRSSSDIISSRGGVTRQKKTQCKYFSVCPKKRLTWWDTHARWVTT